MALADPARRWKPTRAVQLSAGLHGAALGALAFNPAWWPWLGGAMIADHAALGAAGLWPSSQWLGPSLHRLPHSGPIVALTFDDGPDPAVTPRVLDMLAAAGAQASFFCIGTRARAYPALLRRIVAEGHAVENHTLHHRLYFACLAGPTLQREVTVAQALLADLAGVAPRWFRAPLGFRSPLLEPILARAGLHLASWNRRAYDTRCADPALVLERLQRGLGPGDVVLLHDGNAARAPDGTPVVLAALPGLLAGLAARGLSVVPLPAASPEPGDAAETRA